MRRRLSAFLGLVPLLAVPAPALACDGMCPAGADLLLPALVAGGAGLFFAVRAILGRFL